MTSGIEVNGVSPVVAQHNKYEHQTKVHGPHHEEINRHQLLDVVLQKRVPSLRGRLSLARHVLRYRRLRDLNAQLQ